MTKLVIEGVFDVLGSKGLDLYGRAIIEAEFISKKVTLDNSNTSVKREVWRKNEHRKYKFNNDIIELMFYFLNCQIKCTTKIIKKL